MPPVGKQKQLTEPAPLLPDIVKSMQNAPSIEDDYQLDFDDWFKKNNKALRRAYEQRNRLLLQDSVDEGTVTHNDKPEPSANSTPGKAADKGKGKQRARVEDAVPEASSSKAKAPAVKHSSSDDENDDLPKPQSVVCRLMCST